MPFFSQTNRHSASWLLVLVAAAALLGGVSLGFRASLQTTRIASKDSLAPFQRHHDVDINIQELFETSKAAPASVLCNRGVPPVLDALQDVNLLRDCLDPDFEPWKDKKFTLRDVKATSRNLRKDFFDVVALWQIKNQTLTFLDRGDDCQTPDTCNKVLVDLRDSFRRGLASGHLRAPLDITFVVNTQDDAKCHIGEMEEGWSPCKAPVFSVHRRINMFADILVPGFTPNFFTSSTVPWELKKPLAFFRGTPFCNGVEHLVGGEGGTPTNCSRLILSDLADERPDALNVSINEDFEYEGRLWKAKFGSEPVPIEVHGEYKYLLNLDGYASSTRLAQLLGINSVVLKQASVFEEWYYSALKPCVHYMPIYETSERDVLTMVLELNKDPTTAKALVANGQAFALAHLTEEARWKYWSETLWRYTELLQRNEQEAAAAKEAAG